MRSLNILIAEDDDQNQAMLKLILSRRGHRVKSAWNGLQALEAIKTENFDLVFMDLHMPEMDGLEATRQIRTWEDNKRHVLVVILTGSVPPQVSDTYKTAGADTFLSKPFDVKRLDSLINLIASEDPDPAQKNANYNMNGSLGELAVLDEQDALVRFDGDATMYCENLSEFIDSLAGRIERVKQSFSLQQWEDLSQQAHNLKGVSANFGAKVLSVLAHRLDEYSHLQKEAETQQTIEAISQHLVILRATAGQILNQKKP